MIFTNYKKLDEI